MPDKPLCPYCGPWNGHPDGVEMILEADEGFIRKKDGTKCIETIEAWYSCPVCQSNSPFRKTDAEALAVAIRRFQPLQKPLTLEDIKGIVKPFPVWLEIKTRAFIVPVIFKYDFVSETIEMIGDVRTKDLREEDYGIKWRCWRQNPTAEELKCDAAKWENGDSHE